MTVAALWYAETRVMEGVWLHAQAFVFYFGFLFAFLYYLIGLKSVKGILSSFVIGLVLVHMGSTYENMMACMAEMSKPLAWTKLVILSLFVFYCSMAGFHYLKATGGL